MDAPTSPPNLMESNIPLLILDLSPPATSTLPTPSDCCASVLHPSIQLNLPKPRASLLICNPLLPSLGMRTAIVWRQEQLLAAWSRMDKRNHARRAARMIPVTQTTSQILDTAINAMVPWSTATDTTPPIRSQYQHLSHPYLSDPPTRHIKRWPEFALRTRTLPRWQLKLPDSSMKTMKIPLKYWHPLSSQRMKGLPKGWVYAEDDEAGRCEELCDPNQYGHLPPRLILMQQQLTRSCPSNHLRDLSTTSAGTSSPLPSPTNTESRLQRGSSKST